MKKLTTKPGHPVEKGWLQVITSDGYKFIKPEGGSEWTDGDITITDEELLEFMRDGCHDPRSLRPTAPPRPTKTETHFHKRKDGLLYSGALVMTVYDTVWPSSLKKLYSQSAPEDLVLAAISRWCRAESGPQYFQKISHLRGWLEDGYDMPYGNPTKSQIDVILRWLKSIDTSELDWRNYDQVSNLFINDREEK